MTLNQVRNHKFCKENFQPFARGLLPSEKIYVDRQMKEELKGLGCNGFIKDIEENAINQNTTAFYLVLFKRLKENKMSTMKYF